VSDGYIAIADGHLEHEAKKVVTQISYKQQTHWIPKTCDKVAVYYHKNRSGKSKR